MAKPRKLQIEQFEQRVLLAITGPELVAIVPNVGDMIEDADVLHVAPQEMVFHFNEGQTLDPASLGSIQMERSGADGTFDDGNEVAVDYGWIGIGDQPNEVIVRFAETLPDDLYHINLIGSGATPLENTDGDPFNSGMDLTVELDLDLGAQVIAVVPQPTSRDLVGDLQQDRNLVRVYFNDDPLNPALATDPTYYLLFDTNDTLQTDDDTILLPTTVTYDDVENVATLDFGGPLPDSTYRLQVGTSDESNKTFDTAINIGSLFDTTNFSQVAFAGDEDGNDDVDLYRFEIEPGGAVLNFVVTPDAGFDAAVRVFTDVGVQWALRDFAGVGGAESFGMALPAGTYYIGVSSAGNVTYNPVDGLGNSGGSTSGSYRIELDVGNSIGTNDDNSSFGTAVSLGALSTAEQRFSSQIEPQTWLDLPRYPGGSDEPGHRDIPAESHGAGSGAGTSVPRNIGVVPYNFADVYGSDSQGNTLYNQINEDQKDRAREIFEMYASLFGFEVLETDSSGIRVVTGDVRVLLPPGVPPGGVGGISGGGMVIMNAMDYGDPALDVFGAKWMGVALHELGHSIGIMHSYDVRSTMGAPKGAEDTYPGQVDVIHAQRINRPDAVDIDMYEFTVADAGVFTAETVAERLATTSLLNTALRLYRQEDDGSRTLIAQNDDYFSNDSYIEFALEPGTYFVGVSSTGNTDYDPTISDSGFGGLTDGDYDLKLGLAPAPNSVLMDDAGTLFDGDNDGRPGGAHEFFFRSANTVFVDKAAITNLRLSILADSGNTTVRVVDVNALDLTLSGNVIEIDNEQMLVTNVDAGTNTFTVQRGYNSTLVTSHSLGAPVRLVNESGSLARPFGLISSAVAAAAPGDIIRIVGNAGADDDFTTLDDNRPYLIGLDTVGMPLEDGSQFQIPGDVVVQIDAGAIFKLNAAVIDAGTSDQLLNRTGGALQVLGMPDRHVLFTSYADDTIGGDTNGAGPVPLSGDWGGLVFRPDSDFQGLSVNPDDPGIFLNYVNQGEFSYGGGSVDVDSITSTYTAIHIDTTRPTVTNNLITLSADAAMSANPDAFDDSRGRIGPTIRGNRLVDNTINGIFVRIDTEYGEPVDRLSVTARFDDTDIVHVITESLEIVGNAGGPFGTTARPSGRLKVDPGIVVKLSSSRIEAMRGNSHLIAEGTEENLVVFTSLHDDRFGAGGTFDTSNNGTTPGPVKGDWGGLIFNANSRGSIDRALIAYGGGETPIAGGFANFSTIEIHHNTHVRLANSTLADNDDLATGGNRDNRGSNDASLIFVRQAQPIIVNNVFENNDGNLISINANALLHHFQRDTGRSTGEIAAFDQFSDNHGPLVRLNRMTNNGTNGMNVRAEVLTNESVWDDTDIVHVLRGEIEVDQHHTYSGVRLQSAVDASLVVKLWGGNAGFKADGIPLDIDDRIGGTVQIVGQPGYPVVLTSLADDTVGASLAPDLYPHFDTNNDGIDLANNADPSDRTPDGLDDNTGLAFNGVYALPGDWRSLLFEKYSNDRNVRVVLEPESANNDAIEVNNTPFLASFLGELAPDQKSGDENRVLGFQVHGHISGDDPGDVDVYSFKAVAGTEVWIDLDRTRGALDTVVELVQSNGTLLARSLRSDVSPGDGLEDLTGSAETLASKFYNGGDYYTLNHHDAGFRVVLPGSVGQTGTYFVRVRSNSPNLDVALDGGLTSGEYQLQVRLQQRDEKPGSTVRYADVRYPVVGIDVRGLPAHSPLLGESAEIGDASASPSSSANLGNLLESDINTISLSGALGNPADVDMYRFNVDYAYTELGPSIQVIGGMSDGAKTWAAVFDLDYADGLTRADTTMLVFDTDGTPILMGRESNITDDQPLPGQGNDLDDLTRGTVGKLDPFIGIVQLPTGTPNQNSGTEYYVAVSANGRLIRDLNQFYQAGATNANIRLEPINSVDRIIEDHIGFQGYGSTGAQVDPVNTNGLFNITNTTSLTTHVRPFDLSDVVLYVSQADRLTTVNPYFGEQVTVVDTNLDQTTGNVQGVQDIVFRSDGGLFAYRRLNNTVNSAGALVTVNTGTGALGGNSNDNILGTTFAADSGGAGTTPDNTPRNFVATDTVDALTFDRTGFTDSDPDYDVYYAVRANDRTSSTTSVLYLGLEGGSATESTTPDYGIRGNIQPSGVVFASDSFTIDDDGTGTGPTKSVRIVAKAPGAAGNNIELYINQITSGNSRVTATTATRITVGLRDNATAQTLVDVINRDTAASRMVTARLVGTGETGEQTDDLTGVVAETDNGGGTPLTGYVTGLAFSEFAGTNLYGVTSAGEFISINTGSGQATLIRNFSGLGISNFQGLALGPQNVQGGIYSDTLFAITNDGRLVAFDDAGNTVNNAFDTGYVVPTGITNSTGLAFSPLDFNLWHPTTTRGAVDEPGHGINAPYDLSRTPVAEERDHTDPQGHDYDLNEAQGGISFYFGMEEYVHNDTNPYLNYEASRTQLGVLTNDFQRDLTSGSIGGNYNLPGGAYGSLVTDTFDLVSSMGSEDADDRPTLYFNYFLDTEGRNVATPDGTMRDSARVFISTNGGATWNLQTTNNGNGQLTGSPYRDTTGTTELPSYASHTRFSDTADSRQRIQELHDTSNWRQARVDLSDYVGMTGLVLRFDFSTAGTIHDADLSTTDPTWATPVDGFGSLNADDNDYRRGQNNSDEGFYVDDIIIGWSERGEMITGGNSDATSYFGLPTDPDPEAPIPIETGPYQVEIRRGVIPHAAIVSPADPEISVGVTFDPNVRLIPTDNGVADLGIPGKSDDFETASVPFFDPALGWIPQGLGSTSPWFVLPNNWLFPTNNVARSAPYTYTGPGGPLVNPLGNNQNSTMQVTVVTGTGDVTFDYKAIVGPGDAFQVFVDEIGEHPANFEHFDESDTGWHNGEVTIPVTAGVHTFYFRYTKDGDDSGGAPADEGVMIDNIEFPSLGGMILGDRNVVRAQGAFHIENNFVRQAEDVGIQVRAGAREGTGGIEDVSPSSNNPTPGSPINFDTQNILRYAPGVVIQNNVVVGFGNTGIHFAGESDASGGTPAAAVPVGKIINNTIYGGETPAGTGIRVQDNAAPIVLNNILANTATGISLEVDGVSNTETVVGRTLFHNTPLPPAPARGSNYLSDPTGASPLFVDPATGNFYLADGAEAIDRSLSKLPDLPAFVSVKNPIGMPNSDAFSPTEDLYGQPRVDDAGQPPSGVGNEVFHDLGAIERADTSQPFATVIVPQDQGLVDSDPDLNEVRVLDQRMTEFVIQLSDVGVGIDDLSVMGSRVHIWKDLDEGSFDYATYLASGAPGALVEDSDYLFRYDVVGDRISLIPAVGFWSQGATYTIMLYNGPEGAVDDEGIRDLAGNPLLPTGFPDPFVDLTVFKITLVGWDYGDAPDEPWNLAGVAYPSRFENDGARHITNTPYYLGAGVTREDDSLHNPDASGDDLDDGVRFTDALVVDLVTPTTVGLTVTASDVADGYLNAWIDFNGDRDWDDAGEKVFTDELLVAGDNFLTVTVPIEAVVGLGSDLEKATFGRFRFSSEAGLAYTGFAGDGEVEDYQLRLVKYAEDYGDAPNEGSIEDQINDPATSMSYSDTGSLFQSFTPTGSRLMAVDLRFLPGVSFPVAGIDATINIRSDSPAGAVLGSSTTSIPDPAGSEVLVRFDFAMPIGLTPGATYVIEWLPTSPSGSDVLSWMGRDDDPYAGGTAFDPAGTPVPTDDFNFVTTVGDGVPRYPTLLAENGASHFLDPDGPFLGLAVDAEIDGQPNATATGDDLNGIPDDDNGITWPAALASGEVMEITVLLDSLVVGPYPGAYLDAWIDFNQDGDWDDAGEQLVFDDNWLVDGYNYPTFAVPDPLTAISGTTYARIRVSSAGGLSYDGAADDGEVEDYEVVVTQAPTAVPGDSYSADEGIAIVLDGSASIDPDPGDTVDQWLWDLDYDGVTFNVDDFGETLPHTWFDDGVYTIGLKVIDNHGAFGIASTTVTIFNVDPTVDVTNPTVTVNEGAPAFNSGSFSDGGLDDIVTITASTGTVTVDYDSLPLLSSGTWNWTADPNDTEDGDSSQTVTITAWDDDGGFSSTTFLLVVDNVPPLLDNYDPVVIVDEGDLAQNSGTFSDPGTDTIVSVTASVGTITFFTPDSQSGTWLWEYATTDGPDDNEPTVTIFAEDSDGTIGTITFSLTVNNVAPTADAGGPYGPIEEGTTISLSAAGSTDPGDGDIANPLLYQWDFDEDGQYDDATGIVVDFTPMDEGVYTVEVRVTDDDGDWDTASATVTVTNAVPTLGVDFNPIVFNEGELAWNTGDFGDPGDDTVALSASIGTINPTSGPGGAWRWEYDATDGLVTDQEVTITANDGDGAITTAKFYLTINNLAPVLDNFAPTVTVDEGQTAFNAGTVFDAGVDDVTLSVSDGTIDPTYVTDAEMVGGPVAWSWQFDTLDGPSDNRTVTVTAEDSDGAVSTITFDLVVNNVAPTVSADALAITFNEGELATNTGLFGDAGSDTVTLSASIGTVAPPSGQDGTWSWEYPADDGLVTDMPVTITATDSDGAVTTTTFDLTINNLTPELNGFAPTVTVDEGQTAFNAGTVFDAGVDDVTLSVSDGTIDPTYVTDAEMVGGPVAWSWQFDTLDGPSDNRTVTVTAEDSDGAVSTITFDLVVNNVAPTVSADALAITFNEGELATNTGLFGDAGSDTVTLSASIGTVSPTSGQDGAWSWSFPTTDGIDDGQIVTITADDGDGGVDTTDFLLRVNNVAPVLAGFVPTVTVNEGTAAVNSGTVFDPGQDVVSLEVSDGTILPTNVTPAMMALGPALWSWYFDAADGPDTRTVTITARDSDLAETTGSFLLTVNNLPPVLDSFDPAVVVDEGQTATNSGHFSDPGFDTITRIEASRGTIDFTEDHDGDWTWQFDAEDGPAQNGPVTVTAWDSDNDQTSITFDLTVNNVAPVLDGFDPVVIVDEGAGPATNAGTFFDPGTENVTLTTTFGTIGQDDPQDGDWSWSYPALDGPITNYPVSITATDDDSASTTITFYLTVNNVAPTVLVDVDPVIVDEGTTATNAGSFFEPGTDVVTLSASIGTIIPTGLNGWSWSYPATDGPVTNMPVTISANDGDDIGTATFYLTVNNVAPVVAADTDPVPFNEGDLATNTGTFGDQGDDVVTLTASIGTIVPSGPFGGTWSWSFPTTDGIDDGQTVTITADDGDGGVTTTTFGLTVNNVAPAVGADHLSVNVDEGATATNTGAFLDPGDDVVTITASVGAVTQVGTQSGTWSWSFADVSGPDDSQTVTITATDSDGDANTVTFPLTVYNVTPTADAGGPYYVDEGTDITLDGSGSTDPGNDIDLYEWDLDNDGEYDDAVGVTAVFNSADAGAFTVGLRVTDDDGDWGTDTATVRVTEPLGPVDFLEMDDLDPSQGDLWYSLETTHEGFLTIVSLSLNGSVTLYDADANPLTGSPAYRFDYEVGAGERYLFKVSGPGTNVDLRLANLVHQDGASVTVYGTDDMDTFRFNATASRLVTINAVPYHFTDAEATSISFDGAAASDIAILTGNDQNEKVKLWPDHGTLNGADYALTLASTEAVTFFGGGGRNLAKLYDSNQADSLGAYPNWATFSGPTFSHVVREVRNVFAYAEAGGVDTAVLHDLAGAADRFIAKPDYGEMYDDATYYNYAGGFEKLSGTGTLEPGFDDKAQLYDGVGHDVFDAMPHDGIMKYDGTSDHFVAAAGFRILIGYGTGGGTDTANLQDSPNSRDVFIGKLTYGQLYDGKTFFSGDFYQAAVGFEQLNATATPGFNDQARLYDGPGHDVFESTPDDATMNYNGNPSNFVDAVGFRSTIGYATSGGIDVANLHDSPDSTDTFIANLAWAKLYDGGTFYEAAVGFEQTIATASAVAVTSAGDTASAAAGFPDKAKLFDGPGNDVFDTAPNTGILKFNGNPDNFIQALGFRSVIGYGRRGGVDTANLQDSPTSKDTFTAYASYGSRRETYVNIKDGATHYEAAVDFQQITATASAGAGFNDKAKLYDGRGDDVFDAAPNDGTLRINDDPNHFLRAVDFFSVIGLATEGGIDNAILHDSSASKDYFVADPDYGKLYDGATFYEAAIGFEHLTGVATPGTGFGDRADLYDSYGSDQFEADPDSAQYTYAEGGTVLATDFRYVIAHSRESHNFPDSAGLVGKAGSIDTFTGLPTNATMEGADYYVRAWYFDNLTAAANLGDGDVANLVGSDSEYDYFEGSASHPIYQSYARLYGFGFDNRALYFDEVHADAGAPGIIDRAYLTDSVLDDILELDGNTARLYRAGTPYLFEVTNFDWIEATSDTSGDDDTVDDAGHVFDIVYEGYWENP